MNLDEISIQVFKKEFFESYLSLFPSSERKTFKQLKKLYLAGYTHFLKITISDKSLGFMIVNIVPDVSYIHLDYFAIHSKFQNQGYGTKALTLLQSTYKNYDGIVLEGESISSGRNEEEIETRIRRDRFYRHLNFVPLSYEFDLYNVFYTPYIFNIHNRKEHEFEIVDKIFQIYKRIDMCVGTSSFSQNYRYKKLK